MAIDSGQKAPIPRKQVKHLHKLLVDCQLEVDKGKLIAVANLWKLSFQALSPNFTTALFHLYQVQVVNQLCELSKIIYNKMIFMAIKV